MRRQLQALTITLIVFCTISAQLDTKYSFSDFMSTYSKVYEGQEKSARESEFNINYAELLRLRKLGYDAKPNQFMDWHSNQRDDFFNYKPLNSGLQFTERFDSSAPSTDSPSEFDWRSRKAVSPVKNQGKFGASLTFASTAQLESLLAIASNGIVYDLSEQYVLKCQSGPSQNGLRIPSIQVLHESGVSLEFDHPYDPSKNQFKICSDASEKVRLSEIVQDATFPNFHDLTLQQLQKDLVTYGPITVGVSGSDPSFKYAGPSGLISCSASSEVDHAVLLVGYNSTHWFVKNSWGTTWGDKGFGYISKEENNDCRIRSYVNEIRLGSTPLPHLSSSRLLTQSSTMALSISMTDAYNNGWQGYTFGIRQNGVLLGTFGNGFTSGGSYGPVTINVEGNKLAEVFVTQYAWNENQIGFTISAPNGTVLCRRSSGNTFSYGIVLASFCPFSDCPFNKYIPLSFTLNSPDNGWAGNALFLQQNGYITEQIGKNFFSGSTAGPYQFFINGNAEIAILFYYSGTTAKKIGFTMSYLNGTVIYKRDTTETMPAHQDTIFSFCPLGGCEVNSYMTLLVTMTDSGGDGWNGNTFGITQNRVSTPIKIIGNLFTSGSSSGPVAVVVPKDFETFAYVSVVGAKSEQVGFVIKTTNGELIHERKPGTPFAAGGILARFCSGKRCKNSNVVTLTITMTDSGGDGWNGNTFGFKQAGSFIQYFGHAFTSGSTSDPIYIILKGNLQDPTQIVVDQLGSNGEEVGFTIKAPNGTIIYQKTSGETLTADAILHSFCPLRCPTYKTLTLTALTLSGTPDWATQYLGIYQNGVIAGLLGYSTSPTSIKLESDLEVSVMAIKSYYFYTNRIGFTIKDASNNVISQRTPGTTTQFDEGFILSNFCLIDNCGPSSFLTLTITMTDTGNDGWNGNTFCIKQKNKVVYTFGSTFTTGGSSGPLSVAVQGDLQTIIAARAIGTKSQEIGFEVKSSNGTLIYKRESGKTIKVGSLMAAFCPIDSCIDNKYQSLVISMTDSGSDGWNNNVLAIKQNGTLVTTFGDSFTSGGSSSDIYTLVNYFAPFEIVVSQIGTKSEEVGFAIKSINGDTIYERASGSVFYAGSVFDSICTLEPCGRRNYIKLEITMTDSGSDGWNSNVLAFKQNGNIVATFGESFSSGSASGPIYVTVLGNLQTSTQIVVNQIGTNTQEIGFSIKAPNGTLIFERTSGTTFQADTVFNSFCPIKCSTFMSLTVSMVDTGQNGWSGTVLAFSQNNLYFPLGDNFYSGSSSSVTAALDDSLETRLYLSQRGSASYQTGFTITAPNNTKIFYVKPRNQIGEDYGTFCLNECLTYTSVYVKMTDSLADGWNGNILGLQQGSEIVGAFGREFIGGSQGDTVMIPLQSNLKAKIVVLKMGTKSEEIGFVMKAQSSMKEQAERLFSPIQHLGASA